MPARSSWKGFLRVSLVSVPVKAYTAVASGAGQVRLNQLHAECHSRIQYKKTCPIHGEVPNDDIVSGYEYSKGQYVVVDPAELEKLRSEDDKAVKIDRFITPETLDPIYYSERTYYLVPDGPVGQKPYVVLHRAMVEEERYGLGQVVLHGREQLVLLRPVERLLVMTVLSHDNEVVKPSTFDDEVPALEIADEELKLAKTLIEATTPAQFDFASYKDAYTENLTKLIEAKVAGEELVAAPMHEEAQVINLMDALRQSVARAQKGAPEKKAAKAAAPPPKMAPSKPKEIRERKRKSS